MERILLMGAPGSGKSTQGQRLAEHLGWEWISTGEILRRSEEPWVVEQLKTAKLFSDEMIIGILKGALAVVRDAVLDGAVRTAGQARAAIGPEIGLTRVLEIVVPEEELVRRVLARGREQDTLEIAQERLRDYERMRGEVLEVLQGVVEITTVDGTGTPDEVFNRIKKEVK